MRKGVEVITDPEKARVFVDPMRREVVRLLAERPMTEKELARTLGLSDPSIGHHLKILSQAGLVRIAKREVETHGILQKFYEANALAYFVDSKLMPLEIERYFMPMSMERARGAIAAFSVVTGKLEQVSTEEVEKFAQVLNSTVVRAVSKYSRPGNKDREEVIGAIYRDALTHLVEKPDALPERVRDLLLNAHKKAS